MASPQRWRLLRLRARPSVTPRRLRTDRRRSTRGRAPDRGGGTTYGVRARRCWPWPHWSSSARSPRPPAPASPATPATAGRRGPPASWTQPYVSAVLADAPYGFWLLDEPRGATYATDRSGNNRTGAVLRLARPRRPRAGSPATPAPRSTTPAGGWSSARRRSPRRRRTRSSCGSARPPRRGATSPASRTTATRATRCSAREADRSVTMESSGQAHLRHLARAQHGDHDAACLQRRRVAPPRRHQHGRPRHRRSTSTGLAVASGTTSTLLSYSGFWRVGQGSIGWLNTPAFNGDLDNVAIYHSTLPATRVAAHWAAR